MRKKIAIVVAIAVVISLLTGTVAYAKGNIDQRIAKLNERAQTLQELKPLVDEMAANRQEVKTLSAELRTQSQAARKHVKSLKSNPEAVTSEQIEKIKSLTTELKNSRLALKDTIGQISKEKAAIKTARKNKDKEGVKAAYGNVIKVQETRIAQIKNLIELNKQIAAI